MCVIYAQATIVNILQFKDACLRLIVCVALCSHSWSSDSGFPGCFADGRVSQAGIMGSSFKHTAALLFTQVTELNKCLCKSMCWMTNCNTEEKRTFWYNTKSIFPSARSGFTGKLELYWKYKWTHGTHGAKAVNHLWFGKKQNRTVVLCIW